MCGKETILRKRIVKTHRGSLARILKDINYRRIFPGAKNIFEAREWLEKYILKMKSSWLLN